MYLCWQTVWMLFCAWSADWVDWEVLIEDILDSRPPIVSHGWAMNPEEARLDRFWRDYYQAVKQFNDDMSQLDWVTFYRIHGVRRTEAGQILMFEPVVVMPRLEAGVRPIASPPPSMPRRPTPTQAGDDQLLLFPPVEQQRPLPEKYHAREMIEKQLQVHKEQLRQDHERAKAGNRGLLRKVLDRLPAAQQTQDSQAATDGQNKQSALSVKLNQPVTVNLKAVCLRKAAAVLEYLADVKIAVEGLDDDMANSCSIRVENVPLKSTLDQLLRGSGLTWEVCGDHLMITSRRHSAINNFWRGYYAALDRFNANLSKLDWVAYYKNHGQIQPTRDPFDDKQKDSWNWRSFKPVVVVPRIECGVGSPCQPAKDMQAATMFPPPPPPVFRQPGPNRVSDPFENSGSCPPIRPGLGVHPTNTGVCQSGASTQLPPPSYLPASPPPPGYEVPAHRPPWATRPAKEGSLSFGPIAVPVSQGPQYPSAGPPLYRPIPASVEMVPLAPRPSAHNASRLTLEQIARMAQLKIGDEIIIRQIHAVDASFTLTAEQIIWLKQQGVSDPVILVLQARTPRGVPPGPVPQPGVSPSNYRPVPLGPPIEEPPSDLQRGKNPVKDLAPPLGR